MASTALAGGQSESIVRGPRLNDGFPLVGQLGFGAAVLGGLAFVGFNILSDTGAVGAALEAGTVLLLGIALTIALGFEFVNGFHDTANAVATVIYTRSLPAPAAVIWSGLWNFIGVMFSTGAVAYSIIALLPVDLILNIGSSDGFAMIFALLLAAILWNLATWYVGLPNSSSHALIGSILGVGLASQLMAGGLAGTTGVDWAQARKIFTGLAIAPVIGFAGAFLLFQVLRVVARNPKLYREPEGDAPPPTGIRALLIATCTAVSFAHGSNDGQKGMGLIMLILIGCAPTAYALNRGGTERSAVEFARTARAAQPALRAHPGGLVLSPTAARPVLTMALRYKHVADARSFAALDALSGDVAGRIAGYRSLGKVPAAAAPALRNDLYLLMDATKLAGAETHVLAPAEADAVGAFNGQLGDSTRFIPWWVKVAVALALGLGTMVGWKRIVVTVGERIGKTHMTYGMGAAAEMMAASTILLADRFGLPVSTTHILSSGVAGASVANGAGLQRRTILSMLAAWVLTLPAAMTLSAGLYWLLSTAARATGY